MPGTIHVTVLEFKGISSSPKPSAKSLKVSMGKKQYQTWDKGDFLFPITRIRENLVVALLDAGGNEIAHQDIGTIQIIEKGSWDEVFSINGGGNVHLKLQFTLTEEDRNRIRVMRESAMKKKLETNPNIKLRFLEYVTSTSESAETIIKDEQQQVSASTKGSVEIDLSNTKVEASQAGSSLPSAASSAPLLPSNEIFLDSAIPNATDGGEGAPSSPVKHEIDVESVQVPDEKIETPPLADLRFNNEKAPAAELPRSIILQTNDDVASTLQDDHPIQNPQKQGPVKRSPSNVRKMISAFENTQFQEAKFMRRTASVPTQLNRFRKEGLLEERPKLIVSPADKDSTDFKDGHLENLQKMPTKVHKELPSTVTPSLLKGRNPHAEDMPRPSSSREILKEGEESAVDRRRELASETATSSGRIISEERSEVPRAHEHSSRLLKSLESSVAEGSGRGRGTGLESSTVNNSHVASKPKSETLEYCKEEYDSAQSSGMWIFPDNTSRLCITTAGKQGMKTLGHDYNEAKTHKPNNISSATQKNLMNEKEKSNPKELDHETESGSASSPNDSSNGLMGQMIKIAVIVGFGVLVLLTRQKEPMKKQKEDRDNLFHIPDYVDERTLKPWTGKQ